MKKQRNAPECWNFIFPKFDLKMKLSLLFLFTTLLQLQANIGYAQKTKISLDLHNVSVLNVITEIESKSEFKFFYHRPDVISLGNISIKVSKKKVENILEEIFKGSLNFKVIDRQIVLTPISGPDIRDGSNVEAKSSDDSQKSQISGVIVDEQGMPLAGANVVEKGTTNGVTANFDGEFVIDLENDDAILMISYVGYTTKEIAVGNETQLSITLSENASSLEEVVVVGYGTQKKVNLTASVSQIDSEVFENRPIANTSRGLQGAVSNLVITNSESGGQPGASPNINIRGFQATDADGNLSNSAPLVLVDGIRMNINNIDPEDIESVSVLKDAAAASIYGAEAAGGAIVITTKTGKKLEGGVRVSYNMNYSLSKPTIWPESVDALTFAYVMNDARANSNAGAYWDEAALQRIAMNVENPGSAPALLDENNDGNWDQSSAGLGATGATDWKDFLFKDWAERKKHNLSIAGGDQKLNYYISTGLYQEDGLLAVGLENYKRLNLDAKLSAKPKDWLELELYTKLVKSESDYPTDINRGSTANNTSRVFDLLSKIKPTLPTVDPFGEPLIQAYYPYWENQRYHEETNQIVLSPRVIIEPIENLKFNLQLNYRRNNDSNTYKLLTTSYLNSFEETVFARDQESTVYEPTFINYEYLSPNLFVNYNKSIGKHNLDATIGYQSQLNEYHLLGANTTYLITDNVVSFNTSLGENQTVDEVITHWSTQSGFGRLRYNYDEKYLFEVSYRADGSSRFEPDERVAGFASYSAGYNVARENFWPLDAVSTFKLRGSYGTLGNQNVADYQYLSTIPINSPGTGYLFNGNRAIFAGTPDLLSQSLTWETVKTTDFGLDVNAFGNKLGVVFDWYRTDVEGIQGPGLDLPAVLGTTSPNTNIGTSRIEGWEFEINWNQRINQDFSYSLRAVLSDYQRTMVEYPNETSSLAQPYFEGQDLGDIYGFTWDGWFSTDEEYQTYEIDQSFVAGNFWAGDTKYADLDGNGVIDRGEFTSEDMGDWSVIGNTTPRYQYSLNLGLNYKSIDFNVFFQGVGKRDVLVSNHQRFRGPAQGPFHAMVFEEHVDYYRPEDTTSPLGPNTDAYFPAPYSENPGRNNRNYQYNVNRYVQNGAYTRLKSLQIGYTVPTEFTEKLKISKLRIFASGENLFTKTDMLFYDPETIPSGFGSAQSYPLSMIISTGLNLSF
ncbi:TonB-dependent receptor [Zobellia alginiliquefaciens]|uniref:TonB-dependent receptor n=1 Tax=Zobellia alginiliquefaciens TaxID=3032586 RepID=UPI0023E418C7|nr:TonB-dependent receptor [Zobellia alginiliquefaciens]